MKAKYIFEKFTEDSDPIQDMGIGMRHKIEEWVYKQHHYCDEAYIRKKDLKINAENVDISYPYLSTIPEYIRFGTIKGNFACYFYDKKRIKQLPERIIGELTIYTNRAIDFTYEDIKKYCDVKYENIEISTYGYSGRPDFTTINLPLK